MILPYEITKLILSYGIICWRCGKFHFKYQKYIHLIKKPSILHSIDCGCYTQHSNYKLLKEYELFIKKYYH